jgi:hypothetical protein
MNETKNKLLERGEKLSNLEETTGKNVKKLGFSFS